MCSPVALKAFWPRDFVTLLILTVPLSSGRGNLCGCGGDSSPSGADPPRIPIAMSPPSFFNQGADRHARLVLAVSLGSLFCSLASLEVSGLPDLPKTPSRARTASTKHLRRLSIGSFDATDRLSNQGLGFVRRKRLTVRMLLQTCWRGPSPRRCFEANKERR